MAKKTKADFRTFNPETSINLVEKACSSKVKYETEDQAELEADIRYINYYKCQYCDGYHLTQREKNNE